MKRKAAAKLGPVMKEITPKQARFVSEYLVDLNGKQAAIRAGYAAHTADRQASRLLTKAEVRAAVTAGKTKLAAVTAITKAWVVDELVATYRAAREANKPEAATSALTLMARMHGYIVEPTRNVRIIRRWEDMTDEEVAALADGERAGEETRH